MREHRTGLRRVLAAAVVACLVVAACGSDDDDPAGPSAAGAPSGEPSRGGTLTYGWVAETPHLFPAIGPFGGLAAIGYPERFAIYDALAITTEQGEVEYRLAESLETTDDGLTWELKLRPDLVFSDGTPLDAAAVKYNWDDISRPGSGSAGAAPLMAMIAATDVVDDTTLSITLVNANPVFPRLFAQSALITIGSPTAMNDRGEEFGEDPVGAGPYMLEEWVRGDHMTLVRNPEYHDEVYLDEIVLRPIPDDQQRYNTLRSGGLDVLYTLNTGIAVEAADAGLEVDDPPLSGGSSILFNQTRPPFDDVRARQAVSLAIDSAALNESLYAGKGEAVESIFNPDSPFASDVTIPGPDADAAQELFDELADEGHPLEFALTSPAGLTQDQSDYVQAVLSDFDNVSVTVDRIDGTQASDVIRSQGFDAIHISQPKFADPYPSLHNALRTGGSLNYGGYSDEAMDAALQVAETAPDEAAQQEAYDEVQAIFADTAPFVITLRATSASVYDPDVVGALPTLSDGVIDWARAWKVA